MSILIIVLMITLFINMGLQTFNKSLISSSIAYEIESDPSLASFKVGKEGGFSFALNIPGVNLSSPIFRMFDVSLSEVTYTPYFF